MTANTGKGGSSSGCSEVRLAVAGKPLIDAGRVEHGEVEINRFADPAAKMRVIAKIIERQRVDEDAQPGFFELGLDS